jgi:L-fuconolactonase
LKQRRARRISPSDRARARVEPQPSRAISRIDAHVHFWRLGDGDYPWMTPDMQALRRDFGPGDLRPLLDAHAVTRVVLVQAAPSFEETLALLDCARRCPFVAGVVGKVDIETGTALSQLERVADEPLLRGVRPMLADMRRQDWMKLPGLAAVLRVLADRGLTFECMVRPHQLERLARMLPACADLKAVISHAGMPAIAEGAFDEWAAGIERVARDTTACCKLSGLATLAARGWTVDTLRPWVDHLLACFGPRRLIWGSDWPVVLLGGDYALWCRACDALLDGLDARARRAIYAGNARTFYGLDS